MAAAWQFSVPMPTAGERRTFALLAAFYAVVAIGVIPWAQVPGLVDPRIAAIANSAIFVADVCTALLLAAWYVSTGRPALLALAAGYAYAAAMAGLTVATFSGAVFARPLFGDDQTAVWVQHAWRAGIALMYVAAALLDTARVRPTLPNRRLAHLTLAFCTAGAACAAIAYGSTAAPDVMVDEGWTGVGRAVAWSAAALGAVALAIIVAKRAFDDALYLWLALVIVAGIADIALAMLGGARYTLGWHLGRTSAVVSSYLLLAFVIGALAPHTQRRLLAATAAYGGAIAAVLAALLLRWLLIPWLGIEVPYITMFGATAVAVWLGGWMPAVVATVLGYLVVHILFRDTATAFSGDDPADMLQLGLFGVSSALIIGLGEGMRRARDLYRASEIELRERAAQLQRADLHKSQFLAVLSHELRNPLAPLRNGLAVLKLKPSLSAAEKTVEMMERQITQLTRLIDDLLDVSRIDRGKLELRKQRIALDAVARAAIETALPGIEAKQHELVVRYPGQPLYVDGDPVRLGQVIANLLNNAAKFTPEGGRIELAMRAEGNNAVLSVSDTGIGLPPESLGEVFDMFVQLESGRTTASGGLGLGLTLVRSLVARHGGRVEARSAGANKGAEFIVTLPLAPAAPAPASTPLPSHGELRRRILVVDDNVDAAETLAELLRLQGHGVEAVYDGNAALDAAERLKPDVAFVDLNMPGIDGLEVARRLRTTPWGRSVKLVALTGMGQKTDLEQTRQAGFDEHLTKPADPARLARIAANTGGPKVVTLATGSS